HANFSLPRKTASPIDESRRASAGYGTQPFLANACKYWENRRDTYFPSTPVTEREVHKKRLGHSRQELVFAYAPHATSCVVIVWITGRKDGESIKRFLSPGWSS